MENKIHIFQKHLNSSSYFEIKKKKPLSDWKARIEPQLFFLKKHSLPFKISHFGCVYCGFYVKDTICKQFTTMSMQMAMSIKYCGFYVKDTICKQFTTLSTLSTAKIKTVVSMSKIQSVSNSQQYSHRL